MIDQQYWTRKNVSDEQKDRLLDRHEEVLLILANRVGIDAIQAAMNIVAQRFPDPSQANVAPEMPAVSWEPKPFNELDVSERQASPYNQMAALNDI
jgi:hypothetical protein